MGVLIRGLECGRDKCPRSAKAPVSRREGRRAGAGRAPDSRLEALASQRRPARRVARSCRRRTYLALSERRAQLPLDLHCRVVPGVRRDKRSARRRAPFPARPDRRAVARSLRRGVGVERGELHRSVARRTPSSRSRPRGPRMAVRKRASPAVSASSSSATGTRPPWPRSTSTRAARAWRHRCAHTETRSAAARGRRTCTIRTSGRRAFTRASAITPSATARRGVTERA